MNEIWKDVHGYEDLYQISNIGRFKSKQRFKEFFRKNGTFMRQIK